MKHRNDPTWAGSLKSYPANGKTELSPCEELVDSTLFEWHAEKRRALSRQEISLINSAAVPDCPHCGSGDFVKDGRRGDGVQKYLCNRRGSRFNPLTATDGDNSHSLLIKELGWESELHPTSETKGMRDADNPMGEVNAVHAWLKAFLRSHASFKRRDLQGWLNLFWFIWSDPPSRAEKAAKFIEKAVSERNRIKYRDVYGKKLDK